MILEIVGTSVEDVVLGERYGVDRIELCQGMKEHGITPSYGLIKNAVEAVDIPINVIVRPHSKSFHYDENDVQTMITDIEMIKEVGANGVVIGPLTEEETVDERTLERLLQAAEGMDVVFHRAFDFVRDQKEALETILQYDQITNILTSGGGDRPATENIEPLQQLIDRAKGTHLTIMPGYGLTIDALPAFFEATRPNAVHFGSGIRHDKSFAKSVAKEKIGAVNRIIKNK